MDDVVARFLDEIPVGVLATIRKDGTVRQPTVTFVRGGERVFASTESKRAKARDIERIYNVSYLEKND
jgi:uncharacterized pyridoxamine 5'-phosphate oxidase family protein